MMPALVSTLRESLATILMCFISDPVDWILRQRDAKAAFFGHICSGDNRIRKPYSVCLPYFVLSLTDPIHIHIDIHYLPYIYGR